MQLLEVFREVSSKWYEVGIYLGVDESELDKIEEDNPNNCGRCLLKMLKRWRKMAMPKTWLAVVQALKSIGEEKRAEETRAKYNVLPV